ncbi:hypothetical protein F383_24785 [Gossypium arboreum]|uniref:Uncharacterized protein n=1 Tax=Gossypium arboreum TaxID=29729 RepID=A0A0B0NYV7_GOSAR|nr:hypothetical protein F383_24785 [Gossypium arboreum]
MDQSAFLEQFLASFPLFPLFPPPLGCIYRFWNA